MTTKNSFLNGSIFAQENYWHKEKSIQNLIQRFYVKKKILHKV